MRKQICIIILLLACRICNAQNLVPNGDFEQYDTCPTDVSQLESLLFWINPTATTPDYYNSCSINPSASVPNNFFGYQQAHSGTGYTGIYLFQLFNNVGTNWREYIEVPLSSPLISNNCYHFEMFVNLANESKYATSDLGVYLSPTLFSVTNGAPLTFSSQINNSTGYITDTLNWILVSENYTAVGGESYIIIGNFKDDANIDTLNLGANAMDNVSFIYIDDVSFTPCTGINEQNENIKMNIYPNPFKDKLDISLENNELSEIILYDITSRKILQQKFSNTVSLNTDHLARGLYLFEVRTKSSSSHKGKIIKD